jgi:hypothetical protein
VVVRKLSPERVGRDESLLAKPAVVESAHARDACSASKSSVSVSASHYSFEIVFGANIASAFDFEIELKNIILVTLRVFEFSHSLGPPRTYGTLRE